MISIILYYSKYQVLRNYRAMSQKTQKKNKKKMKDNIETLHFVLGSIYLL